MKKFLFFAVPIMTVNFGLTAIYMWFLSVVCPVYAAAPNDVIIRRYTIFGVILVTAAYVLLIFLLNKRLSYDGALRYYWERLSTRNKSTKKEM